jgi:hypothetical protein
MNATLKRLSCCAFALLATGSAVLAQVVPTTPGKFKMKPFGESGASAGIASTPKPVETTYRQTTYIALSPPRQWKSADGKSVLGKLIAFEDLVIESKGAAPDPAAAPTMPAKITVVRDGKARLLVNSKPFEVLLDRLGEDEKNFVKGIEAGVAAKAAKK